MTDIQEVAPVVVQLPVGSELIERGRYAIYQKPDGDWAVLRAANICENCQACGCGEKSPEAIPIPAMMVPFITGQAQVGSMKEMFGMLRGVFGNGK